MSVLRIAHLSDPHFGTIHPNVEQGLVRTLRNLKPSLILLSGDITQRARASQFRAAKQFTHLLDPIPFIAVPGNHDIPLLNVFARLFHPYRGFKELFKDQLERDFRHGDVQVIGLNSTSRWRHVQGDFDHERLERRLAAAVTGAKVRIAVFHHPMDCPKPVDEKNLLRGREKVIALLDKYKVDLVMGGHIHDPLAALSDRRYPALSRKLVIAVAGTCTSWRTRKNAPNSFNLIDVNTGGDQPRLTISRHDIAKDCGFVPVSEASFVRGQTGWEPGKLIMGDLPSGRIF